LLIFRENVFLQHCLVIPVTIRLRQGVGHGTSCPCSPDSPLPLTAYSPLSTGARTSPILQPLLNFLASERFSHRQQFPIFIFQPTSTSFPKGATPNSSIDSIVLYFSFVSSAARSKQQPIVVCQRAPEIKPPPSPQPLYSPTALQAQSYRQHHSKMAHPEPNRAPDSMETEHSSKSTDSTSTTSSEEGEFAGKSVPQDKQGMRELVEEIRQLQRHVLELDGRVVDVLGSVKGGEGGAPVPGGGWGPRTGGHQQAAQGVHGQGLPVQGQPAEGLPLVRGLGQPPVPARHCAPPPPRPGRNFSVGKRPHPQDRPPIPAQPPAQLQHYVPARPPVQPQPPLETRPPISAQHPAETQYCVPARFPAQTQPPAQAQQTPCTYRHGPLPRQRPCAPPGRALLPSQRRLTPSRRRQVPRVPPRRSPVMPWKTDKQTRKEAKKRAKRQAKQDEKKEKQYKKDIRRAATPLERQELWLRHNQERITPQGVQWPDTFNILHSATYSYSTGDWSYTWYFYQNQRVSRTRWQSILSKPRGAKSSIIHLGKVVIMKPVGVFGIHMSLKSDSPVLLSGERTTNLSAPIHTAVHFQLATKTLDFPMRGTFPDHLGTYGFWALVATPDGSAKERMYFSWRHCGLLEAAKLGLRVEAIPTWSASQPRRGRLNSFWKLVCEPSESTIRIGPLENVVAVMDGGQEPRLGYFSKGVFRFLWGFEKGYQIPLLAAASALELLSWEVRMRRWVNWQPFKKHIRDVGRQIIDSQGNHINVPGGNSLYSWDVDYRNGYTARRGPVFQGERYW